MPSGSGKKKSQLKIAGAARLLNTPHIDTAAAAAVTRSLHEALQELKDLIQQHQRSSSKLRVPAAVLSHLGTVLQAVSWAARGLFQVGHTTLDGTDLRTVYARALSVAYQCLIQWNKLTLEHLRPGLRPCPEDGVTPGGWLDSCGCMEQPSGNQYSLQ
jgi:hypothetical protein